MILALKNKITLSDALRTPHAIDECFFQETGQLQGRGRLALRLLEFREIQHRHPMHTSNGRRRHKHVLDSSRPRHDGGSVSERISKLKTAIEKKIGGIATHVESVPVIETFRGEVIWEGVVETFDLALNPKAKRCHAW
jgi:hypothetical protein